MKTKYFLIIGLLAATFAACSRDEESLFDKPAAIRTQEALENATDVLTGAEYGWEMIYFPNLEDIENTRGFVLIAKFNKNSNVSMTAKNSVTTSNKIKTDSASTWVVKSDYGPLLSFDTYNSVFHMWSEPGEDGNGLKGDYEFLILKATPELVLLKGKKYGAYTIMRPMTTNDIAAHYAACEQMHNTLFGNNNAVVLEQNGEKYHLYYGSTGMLYDAAYMEDMKQEITNHYPFCATTDGIVMSKGFGNKKDERIFKWENNRLIGAEGSVISNIDAAPYVDFFAKKLAGYWSIYDVSYPESKQASDIVITEINDGVNAIITQINEQLSVIDKKKYSALKGLELHYDANMGKYMLDVRYILSKKKPERQTRDEEEKPTQYLFNVTYTENSLELTYEKPANNDAEILLTAIPALSNLLASLNGLYALTCENPFNPTLGIKLVNNSNADMWFNLSGKVE